MARGEYIRSAWYFTRPDRPGTHWVGWYDPQTGARKKLSFKSKVEARRFRLAKQESLNAALFGASPWREAIREFAVAIDSREPVTIREYFYSIAHFERLIGQPDIRTVDLPMMQRFVRARSAEVKPTTVAKDVRQLKRIFTYLIRRKLMVTNPCDGLVMPRTEKKMIVAPPLDHVRRLLCCLLKRQDYPLYAAVRIAVETGLRRSDIFALRWSMMRIETVSGRRRLVFRLIDTPQFKSKQQGVWVATRGLRRTLFILRRVYSDSVTGASVWPKKRFETAQRLAPFDFTFHDLRRVAASETAVLESAIRSASRLLSHGSTDVTTGHYLDRLRLAAAHADLLDRLDLPTMPRLPRH